MAAKKSITASARATKPRAMTAKPAVPADSDAAPVVKEAKKFSDRDAIPCMSITSGKYVFVGDKSGDIYRWLTDGDVLDVRVDDLIAAIRTKRPLIFKPRVVIQDDDFVANYPNVIEVYDSLYSKEDLSQILSMKPDEMRKVIPSLPDGAKDSLKTMAIKAIDEGRLDSVQRVRVLDQIFGTDMLLKLTN